MPECRAAIPPLREVAPGHKVACVLYSPVAAPALEAAL
jgi:hypothetical protein